MRADKNNGALTVMLKAIRGGMLSHAYLITGDNREELGMELELLSATLLCDMSMDSSAGDGEIPCRKCAQCSKFFRGCHPDFVSLQVKGTLIRVEDVRRLRSVMSFFPVEAKRRVFVIPECERMNREAANAMLKTLEEPPDGVHILLSTLSPSSLLQTIVSRCQVIRVGDYLSADNAREFCRQCSCPLGVSEFLLTCTSGDVNAAMELYKEGLPEIRNLIIEFVAKGSPVNMFFDLSERISRKISILKAALMVFETVARDILLIHSGCERGYILNRDFEKEMESIASCYGFYSIEGYLNDLHRILYLADRHINRRMLAERMLVFWLRNMNGR